MLDRLRAVPVPVGPREDRTKGTEQRIAKLASVNKDKAAFIDILMEK